jgi:hypothetical protein
MSRMNWAEMKELYEKLKELAKEFNVHIVTTQFPPTRPLILPEAPAIVLVDYSHILRTNDMSLNKAEHQYIPELPLPDKDQMGSVALVGLYTTGSRKRSGDVYVGIIQKRISDKAYLISFVPFREGRGMAHLRVVREKTLDAVFDLYHTKEEAFRNAGLIEKFHKEHIDPDNEMN